MDAAKTLVALAESESVWNQSWHLPAAPSPPTGKEFIEMAAKALGVPPQYHVLSRSMVRFIGWFKPLVGEVYEMLYQNDSPYVFNSQKFTNVFGFSATSYAEAIKVTAKSFQEPIARSENTAA